MVTGLCLALFAQKQECVSGRHYSYQQWPRYECGVGPESTLTRQLSGDPSVRGASQLAADIAQYTSGIKSELPNYDNMDIYKVITSHPHFISIEIGIFG